ncbi:UNVERIFIED_CONTAM: hypothetical protein Sradi_0678200 [Sesamum radiatum]|uniref:DDE Tnp4 domain-containing protein n=1 Tax=Sesamum radiatum TaxID=300843 RepID=A0AAW2VMU3_SESRA
MSRNAFGRLCQILENTGGLRPTRHLTISEQVVIFLSVLAHHKKNCVVKHDFIRSGRTISKHFHSVLSAVLRVQPMLLPRPAAVGEECQDPRWRWFKGCLSALDGTYIDVRVPDCAKGRYRNRKGQTSLNVLGVCNMEGLFTYVLSGWEGSAVDGRVLFDSLSRSTGLKVPLECMQAFKLRHAAARNVIERLFGLLKTRWGILRSPSYYSIDVQSRIVVACCLLHNYVRMEMPDDPLESEVPEEPNNEMVRTWTLSAPLKPLLLGPRGVNLAANMYAEWLHR